jgi:hypothetical protein
MAKNNFLREKHFMVRQFCGSTSQNILCKKKEKERKRKKNNKTLMALREKGF